MLEGVGSGQRSLGFEFKLSSLFHALDGLSRHRTGRVRHDTSRRRECAGREEACERSHGVCGRRVYARLNNFNFRRERLYQHWLSNHQEEKYSKWAQ